HVKRGRDSKIPQSSGPLVNVGDEVVHKELGDRMERAATTASSLEAELDSVLFGMKLKINAGSSNLLLLASGSYWHGERQLQSLVDRKRVIITESSIISDLHLADAGGIDCLPTATIFEELARMGRKQRKETEVPQDETHHDDSVPIPFNDPLLSGEDRMQLTELMILCTNLHKQVLDLEKAKNAQAKEIAGLKKREDASKQGRIKIVDETQGRLDDAEMFDTNDLHGDEVIVDMEVGEKQEKSAKFDEREVSAGVEDSVAPTIPVTTADEGVTAAKIDEFTPTSALTTVIDELTLA
ncbi:hypothetical protein Tco_1436323, partial [Tanacetum coccineum]